MADFAHYSVTSPAIVARFAARRGRPSDEMLLKAFDQICPSPLSQIETEAVRRVLVRKRGRPPGKLPSRTQLTRAVLQINQPGIPRGFLEALAHRLGSIEGRSEFEAQIGMHNTIMRQHRDNLIVGLHRELYALQDGNRSVTHPVIGQIEVPQMEQGRSRRALKMTSDLLTKWEFDPPSLGQMRNIVSRRRKLNQGRRPAP
ncbi:hypothetical protein [Qipengyuania oceanensis]|uniref:Uncharacterized protein n=1 Tax=Qipengyuania oceanensis TaxID=1463597 RepID=A0A844YJI1_9SPHN|nr:hypothetical protein [Qipengyuania oceanensis]MXO63953.1 hypothetical protein [Qipengyuania oceanensis]